MDVNIRELATTLTPRLIEIRRHFHRHPELSGQEQQTASYVAGVLSSAGLRVREEVGRLGVVADLPGKGGDQRCLAIRTDMDALPIQERTGAEFASKHPGIMHACGHDVHTTVGLGTAMILAELQEHVSGKLRFIFQPAEEIAQGARWMIQDGIMADVSAILSLHVFPSIPAGQIAVRYGALTAAADDIELIIIGESGHGARPHEAIDAIWIAAQVITTLQQAISRTQNPLRPVVLTIGKISGGRAANVIADQVQLQGTVRSLHPETREQLPDWIEQIVANVCASYGATYKLTYRPGVPSVQNSPFLSQLLADAATDMLGPEAVQILPEPSLGAEDFSLYLEHAPGAMFRLGVGFSDRPNYPLHHPQFEVDEQAITVGVMTLAQAALKYWKL
ncbi:M20 family metallopeptidase [Candidatus Synechococcus calcipolaris G9]|uniref:M20 family metallopeptidase n=1 Tax=Candidatus Synechococcus calcipolaris G9 TaxID=1497997 RepID=A0ABT6EYR4_9SYNE|nr:M20 family metallopeptidase [Candidatus Synechococcus calcipolaris]MDG2990110.1 M20 family metallopeptidase [Candidatus Synechococcus calcipolaris G9]